jgi:hypothetical protein
MIAMRANLKNGKVGEGHVMMVSFLLYITHLPTGLSILLSLAHLHGRCVKLSK